MATGVTVLVTAGVAVGTTGGLVAVGVRAGPAVAAGVVVGATVAAGVRAGLAAATGVVGTGVTAGAPGVTAGTVAYGEGTGVAGDGVGVTVAAGVCSLGVGGRVSPGGP